MNELINALMTTCMIIMLLLAVAGIVLTLGGLFDGEGVALAIGAPTFLVSIFVFCWLYFTGQATDWNWWLA